MVRLGRIVSVIAILTCSVCGFADCKTSPDFGQWLNCKIQERKDALAGKVAIKANAASDTNQQEAPSMAGQTTSLVDQSSSSDLFNLALNLAKLGAGANNNDTNSVTVTTSAYALYSAINYHDPLDPAFYLRNRKWRHVYLTLGRDTPEATAPTADIHARQPGTIAGVKLILFDHRDLSSKANDAIFKDVEAILAKASTGRDKIQFDLEAKIDRVGTRFASLNANEEQVADSVIDSNIDAFVSLDQVTADAVKRIRRNQQWSFTYTADIKGPQGFDDHRFGMVLDWGQGNRLNLTANAGFDFQNGKNFAADRQGGMIATELQFRITEDAKQFQSYLLGVSGQGEWLTKSRPVYRAQAKLTVPLGQKTGVSVPLAVTYTSTPDLSRKSHVEARFGFSFDAARVAAALLGSR